MKARRIGPFEDSAIGLGCMNLSHAYGTPPPREVAAAVLNGALDGGITLFDTAAYSSDREQPGQHDEHAIQRA